MNTGKTNKHLATFLVGAMLCVVVISPVFHLQSVHIEMVTPTSELRYGEPVTLKCQMVEIPEPYAIQWQYDRGDGEWVDIDCREELYSFVLTEENADFAYRVVVSCS